MSELGHGNASASAMRMDECIPISLVGIGQAICDPVMIEVRNDTLFCRTKIGTVECEIDAHGVAWIFQVTDGKEELWWNGKCSQDLLRGHIKAAIDNANQSKVLAPPVKLW